MENEPPIKPDDTRELVSKIETDTINVSREKTQALLKMWRENSSITKTDILEENLPPDDTGT